MMDFITDEAKQIFIRIQHNTALLHAYRELIINIRSCLDRIDIYDDSSAADAIETLQQLLHDFDLTYEKCEHITNTTKIND